MTARSIYYLIITRNIHEYTMKKNRNVTFLIVFAFVFMCAAKAFGNLYVSSFGVIFALSVAAAVITDMVKRERKA
ncbi:hypothetical protein AT278_14385 [Bacillus cereus]|nr:hypothetical protein AT278_14385 [Bacillus cereus]PEF88586.1 hypothetical protein CON51_05115 [Bacillus thuringiensis]PES54763.1 hypothetical protein CN506_19915 [Bacillus thuringiensis]PFP03546.1 hypothetical protein COJ91_22410 [Bacillus thuringiensis]PFS55719.1 hypothetical protein COK64_23525 [Bacillus thuringiensis]